MVTVWSLIEVVVDMAGHVSQGKKSKGEGV